MRRTITLPDDLDARIRAAAEEKESFSAAISRLLEVGLVSEGERPDWIGSGESDDPDLAFEVEEVLAELALTSGPND